MGIFIGGNNVIRFVFNCDAITAHESSRKFVYRVDYFRHRGSSFLHNHCVISSSTDAEKKIALRFNRVRFNINRYVSGITYDEATSDRGI